MYRCPSTETTIPPIVNRAVGWAHLHPRHLSLARGPGVSWFCSATTLLREVKGLAPSRVGDTSCIRTHVVSAKAIGPSAIRLASNENRRLPLRRYGSAQELPRRVSA